MIKKTLYAFIFIAVLAACSLTPEQIADGIDDCEGYDLLPVAIVRRDAVRQINCFPPDEYLIIEREVDLIKLPQLPAFPGDR